MIRRVPPAISAFGFLTNSLSTGRLASKTRLKNPIIISSQLWSPHVTSLAGSAASGLFAELSKWAVQCRGRDAGGMVERQRWIGRIRRVGGHDRERWIVGQERERVHLVRVVIDPETSAQHGLLAQTIGGADTRGEILGLPRPRRQSAADSKTQADSPRS
jgi:hypothetical protein